MNPVTRSLRAILFVTGSAGLLGAMFVEAAAVIGRHVGIPVMGALEIVQAAIVPAACAAMIIATIEGTHACVHLLTERVPPGARRLLERFGAAIAAVFFAAVCVGCVWLAREYWDSFEQTEVLHIPFRPLRALVALSAAALSAAFLWRALRPASQPAPKDAA